MSMYGGAMSHVVSHAAATASLNASPDHRSGINRLRSKPEISRVGFWQAYRTMRRYPSAVKICLPADPITHLWLLVWRDHNQPC